ncbi:MAG: hypothetical protein OCU12_07015 [Methanophagales archaeon]|nr:hypothetical protein [Methanophagales archaeon]
MALWQEKKGYWCCSDVNLVAAMMIENYIIRDGVIDPDSPLPPVELAFAYVELVPRRRPKKRRRGTSGNRRLVYDGPDPELQRADPREFKPVVMFALAPFNGSHRLTRAKKDMWFNGTLFSPPVYGVQHHALMRIVEQLREEYQRKTGRKTTVKSRSFAIELNDGVPRLAGERSELSEEQEVPEHVAVRGEEARIGARGLVNK